MTIQINLNSEQIQNLDLSVVEEAIAPLLKSANIAEYEQKLQFQIDFEKEDTDPRELSEIPEIRLWFIKLDVTYPWFPFILDWKAGELARYTAMLVPHQFHRSEGIQYNPEALEIFMMQKIFILSRWLRENNISGLSRLKSMAQMLGYDIEEEFLRVINN